MPNALRLARPEAKIRQTDIHRRKDERRHRGLHEDQVYISMPSMESSGNPALKEPYVPRGTQSSHGFDLFIQFISVMLFNPLKFVPSRFVDT
jgi:hypothetical protein